MSGSKPSCKNTNPLIVSDTKFALSMMFMIPNASICVESNTFSCSTYVHSLKHFPMNKSLKYHRFPSYIDITRLEHQIHQRLCIKQRSLQSFNTLLPTPLKWCFSNSYTSRKQDGQEMVEWMMKAGVLAPWKHLNSSYKASAASTLSKTTFVLRSRLT